MAGAQGGAAAAGRAGLMALAWRYLSPLLLLPLLLLSVAPLAQSAAAGSGGGWRGQPAAVGTVRSSHSRRQQLSADDAARFLMRMAEDAQRKGDRKRAISLLVELLRRTPDHARARLMAGRLMIVDGRYDAAWQIMRPLLKPNALDWKPWFWSGTAELMAGRLDAAAQHLDESLARDGRVAAVWVQRALVAEERGKYGVAYQLLKVAEAQSPRSTEVMLNLGFTLDAMGETEAAVGYYQRYLLETAGRATQWRARRSVLARLTELSR
ncbi:MAG: hypothetical protein Q9M13_04005 [Mariprofundales bacterium]|nr:hypothetical protein [Mariprofundales bacterium]